MLNNRLNYISNENNQCYYALFGNVYIHLSFKNMWLKTTQCVNVEAVISNKHYWNCSQSLVCSLIYLGLGMCEYLPCKVCHCVTLGFENIMKLAGVDQPKYILIYQSISLEMYEGRVHNLRYRWFWYINCFMLFMFHDLWFPYFYAFYRP